MQDYEASLSFLGTWGPFQRKVFLVLCLVSIPSGLNIQSVFFLLATPPHHCRIPAHSNLDQDWIQASIPVQEVSGRLERSSCSRYELELLRNLSGVGARPGNLSGPGVVLSGLNQEGCKDGWTYSTEHFQSTVASEFDLVCTDQWKQPFTSFFYFLGAIFGCLFSGPISDRIGRKPVLFGATAMFGVFSLAMAFAPSWPVFTVLFFVMGLGQLSSYVAMFVLGSEILMGSTRVVFSSFALPSVYTSGIMLLPFISYLVPNWRHLSMIIAVPSLAIVPLWWLIPESPRWLISHGRLQEAELLLKSAAMENKVPAPLVIFPPANVEKAESQKVESLGFLDLLRTANMRHITLILWLIWLSSSICYFGVSFNMLSFYGSPFLNYFLLSAVEVPGYAASALAVQFLPRQLSFVGFTLLGSLALLFIQITLHSYQALTMFLVLLGKFGVLAGLSVMYTFSGELAPTVIRNTALSSCAMFSRVGSAVSPYLLQLAVFYQYLPWIIVGCLSLLAVLLSFILPETFKKPLPDTIQQIGRPQRFRWPCASVPAPKDDGKKVKDQTTAPEIICTTHL